MENDYSKLKSWYRSLKQKSILIKYDHPRNKLYFVEECKDFLRQSDYFITKGDFYYNYSTEYEGKFPKTIAIECSCVRVYQYNIKRILSELCCYF